MTSADQEQAVNGKPVGHAKATDSLEDILRADVRQANRERDDALEELARAREQIEEQWEYAKTVPGLIQEAVAAVMGDECTREECDQAKADLKRVTAERDLWRRSAETARGDTVEALAERDAALAVVEAQAEDDGLWFVAETAAEAYVQQELRRLHAVIENDTVALAALDATRKEHA